MYRFCDAPTTLVGIVQPTDVKAYVPYAQSRILAPYSAKCAAVCSSSRFLLLIRSVELEDLAAPCSAGLHQAVYVSVQTMRGFLCLLSLAFFGVLPAIVAIVDPAARRADPALLSQGVNKVKEIKNAHTDPKGIPNDRRKELAADAKECEPPPAPLRLGRLTRSVANGRNSRTARI